MANETGFTVYEKTTISRAFSAGNYANAYETTDLKTFRLGAMPVHERAAFVLGFFSSYELSEISIVDREVFDECYRSAAGQYVVTVAKYADDRTAEYASES